MKSGTEICKIPHPKWPNKFKWPKLREAHEVLCGCVLEKAHDALGDVKATAKIWRHIVNNKLVVI